jgi:hypothetical protein
VLLDALTLEEVTQPRCFPLPDARGRLTEELFRALANAPDSPISCDGGAEVMDPLGDDDLQLALYVCYELHYSGIEDIMDAWTRQRSSLLDSSLARSR